MANKTTSTKLDKPAQEQEPKLKASVYIKATFQMLRSWVGSHKIVSSLIILVLAAMLSGSVYWLSRDDGQMTNDEVVISINKQLGISGDSNPAILAVVDSDKTSQPFLEQSQNGDKVVLYYKAKKSVLYRPSTGQVIHHGTYTPPPAKIFVRKGTLDSERVDAVKDKLKTVQEAEVNSQDDSPNKFYKGVTIVSITDRYDDKLAELEKLFGVKASRLPDGESFPDADFMIIVGE